jgi:membrane protease YdiL (CAAX protease family)
MLGQYEPRPRKPPVWTVVAVLVVAIIAYAGSSLAAAIIYTAFRHQPEIPTDENWRESALQMVTEPAGVATLALAAQLSFLVVTLTAAWLSPMGVVRRLRLGRSGMPWPGYLTLPVGMLSINFLFQVLVKLLRVPEGGTLDVLQHAITQLTPGMLVVMLLVVGVMPGFSEEFLFRGYVQGRLAARWGPAAAILISAALFGLFHFDKLQSPATFLMGLYLGYVAYRAGSIRPAMFAHMFNNTSAVLYTWYSRGTVTEEAAAVGSVNPGAVLLQVVGCLVLIALCCLYLHYRVRPPQDSRVEEWNHDAPMPDALRLV